MLKHLRKYIDDESHDKRKESFDLTGWTDAVYKEGTPQQHNGSDCGVFMCRTAEHLASGSRLTFTQQDMNYLRRRMCLEIMHLHLIEDDDVEA